MRARSSRSISGSSPSRFSWPALTTLLCLIIGFPVALAIVFASERWRAWMLLLIMLPFWTNLLIRTYALIAVLRTEGYANFTLEWLWNQGSWLMTLVGLQPLGDFTPLQLLYNNFAVVVGLVYVHLPFMVLPLYAALDRLDKSLIEASLDLGAGHLRTLFSIVVPLALPGIISGIIITFVPALGAYLTPDLLGGPDSQMIANVIERQFKRANDWPFGAALSFLLMYATFAAIAFRAYVSPRQARGRSRDLAMAQRRAPLEYNRLWQMRLWLFAVFFFLYAPLVALIAFSFNDSKRNTVWRGFTLKYYEKLFNNEDLLIAFANSLTIALLATLISLVIGALAAVLLWRYRFMGKAVVEGAFTLPLVVPEICMGVAMLLFFTRVLPWPNNLIWPLNLGSIIIAHVSFCFPFVALVVRRQARELQQGAGGGGARPGRQRLAGVPRCPAAPYSPGTDRGRSPGVHSVARRFRDHVFHVGAGHDHLPGQGLFDAALLRDAGGQRRIDHADPAHDRAHGPHDGDAEQGAEEGVEDENCGPSDSQRRQGRRQAHHQLPQHFEAVGLHGRRWTMSASTSSPESSSRCSGPRAAARRRCCACSPASRCRPRATS